MSDDDSSPKINEKTPETNWSFNDDAQSGASSTVQTSSKVKPVEWVALEFIAHEKSPIWYIKLAVASVIIAGVIFILTKDAVSLVVVLVVAIIFGVFASRKPRELNYSLDGSGLQIGEKHYPFSGFKSFSVVQEDAVHSVWLLPLKRFMPIIPIYYDPKEEAKIVETLADILPMENRQPDIIDRLMHRLRF